MALTLSNVHPQFPRVNLGGPSAVLVNATFDNSYPTGGESLAPGDLGLSEIFFVFASPDAAGGAAGFVFQYDYTTKKLKAFDEGGAADAPLTELADTSSDLDGDTVKLLVLGI
jgi:hypothetical protein